MVSEPALKKHVKENLAGYKVPRVISFIDELPRNPAGKVLKRELVENDDGKTRRGGSSPAELRAATTSLTRVSGPERYEIPPERLERWLARWAEQHGGVARTRIAAERVTLQADDGAVLDADPPFPPLGPTGVHDGMRVEPLLEHVRRDRVVGVLLVRLGGHAAGVFSGTRLADSKVGSRLVHGRHRAGGSSQGRFSRRREGQARVALEAAADVAARVLLPHRADLEALVLGGDRRALTEVMADPRLRALARLATDRVLDVPDPRLDVLRSTPQRFRATLLQPR